MNPLFDPRDVKVAALLTGGLAVGAFASFAAPATANANKHRYLLAVQMDQESTFTPNAFALQDQNGNLLVQFGMFTNQGIALVQPLAVGIPGQNGLRVMNIGPTAGKASSVWVQFADVQAQLTADLFRT